MGIANGIKAERDQQESTELFRLIAQIKEDLWNKLELDVRNILSDYINEVSSTVTSKEETDTTSKCTYQIYNYHYTMNNHLYCREIPALKQKCFFEVLKKNPERFAVEVENGSFSPFYDESESEPKQSKEKNLHEKKKRLGMWACMSKDEISGGMLPSFQSIYFEPRTKNDKERVKDNNKNLTIANLLLINKSNKAKEVTELFSQYQAITSFEKGLEKLKSENNLRAEGIATEYTKIQTTIERTPHNIFQKLISWIKRRIPYFMSEEEKRTEKLHRKAIGFFKVPPVEKQSDGGLYQKGLCLNNLI